MNLLMALYHQQVTIIHFFKISSNSEAYASEILENIKVMYPQYNI